MISKFLHESIWLRYGLLSTMALVSISGSYLIFPISALVRDALNIETEKLGLLFSTYSLAAAAGSPVFGWLADTKGRRIVVVSSLFIFGISGALMFVVQDFSFMLLLRVLQGFGVSGIMPLTLVLIGDFFESGHRTSAMTVRMASIFMGSVAFPIMGGVLGDLGWNLPFLLFTIALPVSVLAAALLNKTDTFPREKTVKTASLGSKEPSLELVFLSGLYFFMLGSARSSYLPIYMNEIYNLSATDTGVVVSLGALTSVLCLTTLSKRLPPRTVVWFGFLFSGLAISSLYIPQPFPIFLLTVSSVAATNALQATFLNLMVVELASLDRRGRTTSFWNILKYIGQASGPILLGFLVSRTSLTLSFGLLGVLTIAIALAFILSFVIRERGEVL